MLLTLSRLKELGKSILMQRAASAQGLKIRSFDEWQPELDDVLESLPDTELLPRELYRLLMNLPNPNAKLLILVEEQGVPVALAGLRNRWGYWEPVTQWIIPGVLFPVSEGYLDRVLPVLGVHLKIGWWRWKTPPPQYPWVKNIVSESTYNADLKEDFEEYWHKSSLYKNVRKFRNRCNDFELKVNPPGGAEWVIRNSEAKWRSPTVSITPETFAQFSHR